MRLRAVVHRGPFRKRGGLPDSDRADVRSSLRDVELPASSLLAIVIVSAEFKYSKVVENFKFLQFVPGLALFYVLYFSLTQHGLDFCV